MSTTLNPAEAIKGFAIFGDFVDVKPYGTGHINDTFLATFDQAGTPVRYTLQHINTNIFKDPVGLMDNVKRVTEHSRRRLAETHAAEPSRRALKLVPSVTGGVFHVDADGQAWRCYLFVEKCHTLDVVDSPASAFEAARAFARFQALLADLPGGRLNETIPDFHNTPKRYAAFHAALEADKLGRAKDVRREIDFALAQEDNAGKCMRLLQSGEMPERATHNDTKINNVLLDSDTHKAICVIDLDTVMPGSSLYDYGDSIRFGAATAAEDERDLSRVSMSLTRFAAFTRGFLGACPGLTPRERETLPLGAYTMTLEVGMRFLTDYLNGDKYFSIDYPEHNKIRCRTQFKLISDMEAHWDDMRRIVEEERER